MGCVPVLAAVHVVFASDVLSTQQAAGISRHQQGHVRVAFVPKALVVPPRRQKYETFVYYLPGTLFVQQ